MVLPQWLRTSPLMDRRVAAELGDSVPGTPALYGLGPASAASRLSWLAKDGPRAPVPPAAGLPKDADEPSEGLASPVVPWRVLDGLSHQKPTSAVELADTLVPRTRALEAPLAGGRASRSTGDARPCSGTTPGSQPSVPCTRNPADTFRSSNSASQIASRRLKHLKFEF